MRTLRGICCPLTVLGPETEKLILQGLIGSLFLAGAALAVHLWTRWRNRMVTLGYQVGHRAFAMSADHPQIRTIQVLYNDRPVQNLSVAQIRLSNESNVDLSQLELDLGYNDGTGIIYAQAILGEERRTLAHSARWLETLERYSAVDDKEKARTYLTNA